ncbi:MAG: DUF4940 domain-containing protein [Fervidobacterium sp.]
MRIYSSKDEVQQEKQIYADIALTSKVKVEYSYNNEKYILIPYSIGDITLLIEIKDEKEIIDKLLDSYIRTWAFEQFTYPEEIKRLSKYFKTELKKFRILVVKYNSPKEKEFSRYSLSNITFGVVSYENLDIHLLPSNADVKTNEGYALSNVVETAQEGLRQALLISKWFNNGSYKDLPKLALQSDVDLSKWYELLNYVLFSDINEQYIGLIIKKLNEFKEKTYFNPARNIEKVALGIILTKYERSIGKR